MPNSASPYSNRLAVGHQLARHHSCDFGSISFMSFIDSMMQSTLPGCTVSPIRTKGGLPGDDAS